MVFFAKCYLHACSLFCFYHKKNFFFSPGFRDVKIKKIVPIPNPTLTSPSSFKVQIENSTLLLLRRQNQSFIFTSHK